MLNIVGVHMVKMGRFLLLGFLFHIIPQIANAGLESGVAAFEQGDYRTAYRELRPLAEKGDPKAQYYIGSMYYSGRGVAGDAIEALKWIKPAAEKGIAEAQYFMALSFAGVPAEAIRWLTLAANQSHVGAQEDLARHYKQGLGAPRDLVQAYMWCMVAELNGAKDCSYNVPTYQMTADQRAEAKRLTQEWVAKHSVNTERSSGKSAQQLIAELDSADYKRKKEIGGSLIRMGDASAAAAVETFRGGTSQHMEFLTEVLCARGTEAASAVPELMRLFNSPPVPDPYYKMYILSSLGCVGKNSPEVQSLVISILKGDDKSMRPFAAHILGMFDVREGVLALADALSDPMPSVREGAAGTLMRMGPKAAPAIPALGRALDQKGNYIAATAANALKAIGTPDAMVELKKHGVE